MSNKEWVKRESKQCSPDSRYTPAFLHAVMNIINKKSFGLKSENSEREAGLHGLCNESSEVIRLLLNFSFFFPFLF